jgi:hypothetical protein
MPVDPLGPPLPACGGGPGFRVVITWRADPRIRRISLRGGTISVKGRARSNRWTVTVTRVPVKRTLVITAGRLSARKVLAPCAPRASTLRIRLKPKR